MSLFDYNVVLQYLLQDENEYGKIVSHVYSAIFEHEIPSSSRSDSCRVYSDSTASVGYQIKSANIVKVLFPEVGMHDTAMRGSGKNYGLEVTRIACAILLRQGRIHVWSESAPAPPFDR